MGFFIRFNASNSEFVNFDYILNAFHLTINIELQRITFSISIYLGALKPQTLAKLINSVFGFSVNFFHSYFKHGSAHFIQLHFQ